MRGQVRAIVALFALAVAGEVTAAPPHRVSTRADPKSSSIQEARHDLASALRDEEQRQRSLEEGAAAEEEKKVNLTAFDFDFGFRLLSVTNEVTPNVTAAIQYVELAVLSELQQLVDVEEASDKVVIDSVGSTQMSACQYWNQADRPEFDTCTMATTTIKSQLDAGWNRDVVRRAALDYIHKFVAKFNNDSLTIPLEMRYESPVFLSTSVRMTFVGVSRVMEDYEMDVAMSSFKEAFGTYMETQSNPPLHLLNAKILLQKWVEIADSQTTDRRQLRPRPGHRQLNLQEDSYNDVEVFVQAQCDSNTCTDEYFEDFVQNEGQEFVDNGFVEKLKDEGREAGTDYFESLQDVQVSDDMVDLLPPGQSGVTAAGTPGEGPAGATPAGGNATNDGESSSAAGGTSPGTASSPYGPIYEESPQADEYKLDVHFVYITAAVCAVILLIAFCVGGYFMFSERNKANRQQREMDDHLKQVQKQRATNAGLTEDDYDSQQGIYVTKSDMLQADDDYGPVMGTGNYQQAMANGQERAAAEEQSMRTVSLGDSRMDGGEMEPIMGGGAGGGAMVMYNPQQSNIEEPTSASTSKQSAPPPPAGKPDWLAEEGEATQGHPGSGDAPGWLADDVQRK